LSFNQDVEVVGANIGCAGDAVALGDVGFAFYKIY